MILHLYNLYYSLLAIFCVAAISKFEKKVLKERFELRKEVIDIKLHLI